MNYTDNQIGHEKNYIMRAPMVGFYPVDHQIAFYGLIKSFAPQIIKLYDCSPR